MRGGVGGMLHLIWAKCGHCSLRANLLNSGQFSLHPLARDYLGGSHQTYPVQLSSCRTTDHLLRIGNEVVQHR
ncbi:hypothetical protein D3C77_566530 [compost metagenome]